MLRLIDQYFLSQEEPPKSCLQSLREHILALSEEITETWNYGMPFYRFQGKRFCYLWIHNKHRQPYIGIVDAFLITHPDLIAENRRRMKILLIDPEKDLPVDKIDGILLSLLSFYKAC